MSACYTCGGFGMHHDPVAHDEWAGRCDTCGEPMDLCGGCTEECDNCGADDLNECDCDES